MADNFTTNAGSGGSTFASDEVSAVQYPRIKVSVGADGTAQDNWTAARCISAASTNATNVKASKGAVGFIFAVNLNAAVRYLKLYDKASSPTVGTDTPIATLPIPASATGAGFMIDMPGGLAFPSGISYALTTGYADNDTAAVAAGEIFLLLGYA